MLRLSAEQRIKAFGARRDEILASIVEAKADGNSFGVKQLEATKKRVDRTLKSLREHEGGETEGAVFEHMGFDMLVVDEAHYYKNLAVVGRSVAGMSSNVERQMRKTSSTSATTSRAGPRLQHRLRHGHAGQQHHERALQHAAIPRAGRFFNRRASTSSPIGRRPTGRPCSRWRSNPRATGSR